MKPQKRTVPTGSPSIEDNVVNIILLVLGRQDFSTFYLTTFEDFISGVSDSLEEKQAL